MANSHESRNDDEPMPRKGSERLAATKQNADYWFEAGKKENNIEAVAQCLMQSINAWKNAAYTLAEELADARSESGTRCEQCGKEVK